MAGLRSVALSYEQRQAYARDRIDSAVRAAATGNKYATDRALGEAVVFMGGDSGAYAFVGQSLVEKKRPETALRILEVAGRNKEAAADPRLWAAFADAQRALNRPDDAKDSENRAASLAADTLASADKVSFTDESASREQAEKLFRVGLYYDMRKDVPNAMRALEAASRLAPKDPIVLNAYGYLLADKGTTKEQYEKAVQISREAVRIAPGVPVILDTYGWALFKTGDYPGARRVLREAADGAPREAEIVYHLGALHLAEKRYEDARREFDRALVLNPNLKAAQEGRLAAARALGVSETVPVPAASDLGTEPKPDSISTPKPSTPTTNPPGDQPMAPPVSVPPA